MAMTDNGYVLADDELAKHDTFEIYVDVEGLLDTSGYQDQGEEQAVKSIERSFVDNPTFDSSYPLNVDDEFAIEEEDSVRNERAVAAALDSPYSEGELTQVRQSKPQRKTKKSAKKAAPIGSLHGSTSKDEAMHGRHQIEFMFPRLPKMKDEATALRKISPLIADSSGAPMSRLRQSTKSPEKRSKRSMSLSNSLLSNSSDKNGYARSVSRARSLSAEDEQIRRRLQRKERTLRDEMKSARIFMAREKERNQIKETTKSEEKKMRNEDTTYAQKRRIEWQRRLTNSPFQRDLNANAEYNEHKQRQRERQEQQRREREQKKKKALEKKFIIESLLRAPNYNNQVLNNIRYYEERKKRRALEVIKKKEIIQEKQKKRSDLIALERLQRIELRALEHSL